MAKAVSLVGAQNAANVQVKQQAAKLVFHFKTPNAQAANWPTLIARMNGVELNVELQSKNGQTETLIPKMNLGVLAEIYSSNEGEIDVKEFDANNHEALFSVELGTEGALRLSNETSLVIDVSGMVANDTLDIYAVDFPVISGRAIKTNSVRFNANAEQTIGLANATHLHLPKANFTKLELLYNNGRNITLLPKEIESFCNEGNQDTGSLKGVKQVGGINFYSMNVVDCASAKITFAADVNAYLFTHVAAL